MLTSLSIIIPMYNEEKCLPAFFKHLIEITQQITVPVEIIVVDDCSTDNSVLVLKNLTSELTNFKIKHLDRNYGQAYAMTKGIEMAITSHIAFLDCDGQNNPESIIDLLTIIDKDDYDVVLGFRKNRKDDLLYKVPSAIGNLALSVLFQVWVKDTGCTLRLGKTSIFKQLPHFSNSMVYWNLFIKKPAGRPRKRQQNITGALQETATTLNGSL